MSAPALLDVRDLSRDYKSGGLFEARRVTRALDEVSIRIEAGSIFGIVGESGCGKSTLARIVAALDRPTSGKVLFEGQDLHALPAEKLKRARRDFQMIFQDPFGSFDPRHMVGRIVAEPLHVLESRPGKHEARERVISMLDAVGLPTEAARLFPHEFSGGQRQRIAIARALITEPKLVIADEPVSALDLSVQAQVLNLILDLREKKGVAFLFISHSLSVIDCIAEFVGVMYQGRLVETGPTRTIFDEPLHPYTRLLRDSSPSIHKLGNATGARPAKTPRSASTPSTGCAYRSRCPVALERCVIERPELRAIETGRTVACHAI